MIKTKILFFSGFILLSGLAFNFAHATTTSTIWQSTQVGDWSNLLPTPITYQNIAFSFVPTSTTRFSSVDVNLNASWPDGSTDYILCVVPDDGGGFPLYRINTAPSSTCAVFSHTITAGGPYRLNFSFDGVDTGGGLDNLQPPIVGSYPPPIIVNANSTYWVLIGANGTPTNGFDQWRTLNYSSVVGDQSLTSVNNGGSWINGFTTFTAPLRITGSDDIGAKVLEPVVIVPGILGSTLNRVSDDSEAWPNVPEMERLFNDNDAYLDELKLDSNGHQAGGTMNPTDIVRKESILGVGVSFYGNLIKSFIDNGYIEGQNLFVAPYDWRLDIGSQNVTNAIAASVRKALSVSLTGKLNIVAHSLGGLAVKEYLVQNPAFAAQVDKLILVGVPQLGAPKMFKVRNYGDNLGFNIGPIDILDHDRIKGISANMPSVYQLLPTRRYLNVAGGYVKDFRSGASVLGYDATKQFSLANAPDTNSTLWDSADLFHQSIDAAPFNVSSLYNIAGCQNPDTIGEFLLYPNGNVDVTAVDGDGTVPTLSAMNLGGDFTRNYFVLNGQTGVNHLGLVRDPKPLDLIKNIVNGQPDVLPQGVSLASADCSARPPDPTRIIFGIHSPAELHIYDSQNRHVGPAADGNTDLQISGSDYFTIGENKFASVPAGDNYRVEVRALSSGSFDLKVKVFNGDVLENTVTYLSVPLRSASTTAELRFSGISGDLILKLDGNGDGITDQAIAPNAILQGVENADITPPLITISGLAGDVLLNSTATISFLAADDLSGVAILKAVLDGVPVNNGEVVTLASPGTHLLHVEALDKAGNLAAKDFGFNAVYNFGGFLSPIKPDGSGIYKQGRSLPVKFQLADGNGNSVPTAIARLFLAKVSNGIAGTEVVAVSTGAHGARNRFRYDPVANQYVFNLSLSIDIGTWRLRVELDDGESYNVNVSIKT